MSPWTVRLLAFLRFMAVSLLAFLLLSPYIKNLERIIEPPIIVLAQDNSQSLILTKDSTKIKEDYLTNLNQLKNTIAESYELKFYTFGEAVKEDGVIDFKEKQTDISQLIEEVENRFSNRNVGALIISSDGIYNKGSNPLYQSANFDFPIYSIALGDTTIQKDLKIERITANKIAYLNNQFPIEIQLNAQKLKGQIAELKIYNNGQLLHNEKIQIDATDYLSTRTVILEAKKVGLQKYSVQLTTLDGEISVTNNQKSVYVDVLDGREKILLLANSPHPDVAAIKRSIENNENYEVKVALIADFNEKLDAYNLVILHNLPANSAHSSKLKNIISQNISTLFVVGAQTNIQLLNQLNTGLSISARGNQSNEITAVANSTFPLFSVSENAIKNVGTFPPLNAPFGKYMVSKQSYTLLNQKIGTVKTEDPLWFFIQDNNRKTGFIIGEGIWRWSLTDFEKNSNNNIFSEFIEKSVQYLSVKADKSFFRVSTENDFLENETVIFDAQLYNESYELVNDVEVSLLLKNQEDKDFSYTFSKTENAYYLNAGKLAVGDYSYTAKVNYGGKTLAENGTLTVLPLDIESNNIQANKLMLEELSKKYGGKTFSAANMQEIVKEIKSREDITSVSYSQNKLSEVINLKWVFFLLLSLLSIEWFIRKRNGSY